MSEILDNEIANLLKKYNIPPDIMEIIADEAMRISLDSDRSASSGVVFYSKDDGKLFAITRCIEKIRRTNSQYSQVLDKPGFITYSDDKEESLKIRRPEYVIDMDNFDVHEERKKSVLRYSNTYFDNKFLVDKLNSEIKQMESIYSRSRLAHRKVGNLNQMLNEYKGKVTDIEVSIVPNIFRRKKLREYNEKVRTYMKKIDEAELACEIADKDCDKADQLVFERQKRIRIAKSYNQLIGTRVGRLVQTFRISQDEIKEHLHEAYGVEEVPRGFITLPREDRDR